LRKDSAAVQENERAGKRESLIGESAQREVRLEACKKRLRQIREGQTRRKP
jgi:hypothetical protein